MRHVRAGGGRPLLLLLLIATTADAQTPAFEVASIKRNDSGREQMMIATPPSGSVRATNVSARLLMRFAYDIPEFRIDGEPNWSVTEHFDIVAKAPPNAPMADMRAMFRTLLAERFGLRAHAERRDESVDVLTLARPGTLGPQLSRAEPCATAPTCYAKAAFGRISTTSSPLEQLAAALTVATRRTVVNRTGLDGYYAFTLTFTPDALVMQPSLRSDFPDVDADGPRLTTALNEQLGLKLTSTHEPVDVLVVDAIARPPED